MHILLSNDDGITAPGLTALYRAARQFGKVTVVAPAGGQSAMSHALTHHMPIPVRRQAVHDGDGAATLFEGWAVEGRPADCVKLALSTLVKEPIDLVLSGMNAGANIGINVLYSGTVGAAMEAAIQGLPAIAVSLHIGDPRKTRWRHAGDIAHDVIGELLKGPVTPGMMLNVNLPILDDGKEPGPMRVCPMSVSPVVDRFSLTATDPEDAYLVASTMAFHDIPAGTDVDLIFKRHITVTPLRPDMNARDQFAGWATHIDGVASGNVNP
jgi:5'-nucleotidase